MEQLDEVSKETTEKEKVAAGYTKVFGSAILPEWLSPTTLSGFASGYFKEQFVSAKPYSYLVIDSFLEEKKYEQLLQECQNSPKEPNQSKYGLSLHRKMNWGYFPNISFLKTLFSQDFRALLKGVVGSTVVPRTKSIPQLAEFLPGSQGFDNHNDYAEPFDMVMLLYLADPNQPVVGGEFCVRDRFNSVVKKIAPSPNRLVIFQIAKNSFHSVEDVGRGGAPRLNLTVDWVLPESERAKARGARCTA